MKLGKENEFIIFLTLLAHTRRNIQNCFICMAILCDQELQKNNALILNHYDE